MVTKRAILEWISKELGGRSKPPAGVGDPPYATIVRFVNPKEPWPPSVAWTLVVRKVGAGDGPLQWVAAVNFLFEEAPQHLLAEGNEFELYEGRKRVARGRIID
jgi:hypothetical protein